MQEEILPSVKQGVVFAAALKPLFHDAGDDKTLDAGFIPQDSVTAVMYGVFARAVPHLQRTHGNPIQYSQ
jgi:hypothetical protein